MASYTIAEGQYETGDARFAIVAARFNHHVVDRLLEGALATFERHGVGAERIEVVRAPGAFELPLAAQWLGQRDDICAVVTLGCVIRGETPHFDYVCNECARGVGETALALGKPVIFGVVTTNDQAQADERAGGAHGNKGSEAALAALEMVSLMRPLS
ncbi:MAG: 6,7-dimethyl-8-ribityllumazine synthase [Gammaproteobacteria bacterium]|jgi:6,7-dimethyl-8-ribityllumazine synthase